MERVEFLKLIDDIYNGDEYIPWKELNKSPQQAKFIGGLLRDRKKILDLFVQDDVGRKGGISGKSLPITVKILNRNDENPAVEKYVGFDNRWLVIYFGISPELENFVSIVMWPSESKSSKECYQTILTLLEEEKKSLKFTGSYHIILPNEIHPQQVEKLEIVKDEQLFYNWQYFPFIKDVGETLSRPISAPNYRKVLLRNGMRDLIEEYITIRATIGSIIGIKGNEIKVKVPFLNSKPHAFIFRLRHNIQRAVIKKGFLYFFLLVEQAGETIPDIFEIECAEVEDALAHCLAFELYRQFVNNVTRDNYRRYSVIQYNKRFGSRIEESKTSSLFRICSIEDSERLFRRFASLLCKIYQREIGGVDLWDSIFKTHLLPYFKIDEENDRIYYFPPLFRYHSRDFLCEKLLEIKKAICSYTYLKERV
jgi:hypothetical protein